MGIQAQVLQALCRALGVATDHLRRMQLQGGPLHAALAPVQPELAAGLQPLKPPLLRQLRRHPARPVALRQAQVQRQLGFAPDLGMQTAAQPQGQRLAIGQDQATIQALATALATQAEVDIGERHWRLAMGLDNHLTVEQRQPADALQAGEDNRRRQRLGVGPNRQALSGPLTVFALLQVHLQTFDLQIGNLQLHAQQAAEQIRNHPHLIQA